MASKARPTEGGVPMFKDIISKEEKEAVLDRKMEEMRRKNAMREKRYALIEADKKAAEKRGQSVTTSPVEQPRQAKGVNGSRENKPTSRYAMGRGKRLERMSKEKLQATEYEESQRKQNADTNPPPPDPSYQYLADSSRKGPLPARQTADNNNRRQPRTDKDKQYRQSGGSGSGGCPQTRSSGSDPHMTNRERRQYQEWKSERQKIDQSRVERAKLATGNWKREWDHDKREISDLPQPPVSRYSEPAKRPGYSETRSNNNNNRGSFGKMECYDVREKMPVTRTITRSRRNFEDAPQFKGRPKSQNFEESPPFKGRPKSQNFDERPVMMRQKSNEHQQRPRPKSQNFEYAEPPKSKGRPKSQNFDDRVQSRNRSKSQNYDDDDTKLNDRKSPNEETLLKVRFADGENTEQLLKVRFADDEEENRPKKRHSLQEDSARKSPRSVQERNESLVIKFDSQARTDMNFSLQHIDFDGFHGNGGFFSPSDHQAQRGKARSPKPRNMARKTSASKTDGNWRQKKSPDERQQASASPQEASKSAEVAKKVVTEQAKESTPVKSNKQQVVAPHGENDDDDDDEDVGERDAHNSSAESLERFIEEHTLRLDDDLPSLLPASEPANLDWAEEMKLIYGDVKASKQPPIYGRPMSLEESPKGMGAGGSTEESGEDETLESTVTDDDTLRSVGESLDTSSVADVEELDEETEAKKQVRLESKDEGNVDEVGVRDELEKSEEKDAPTGETEQVESQDVENVDGEKPSHSTDDVVGTGNNAETVTDAADNTDTTEQINTEKSTTDETVEEAMNENTENGQLTTEEIDTSSAAAGEVDTATTDTAYSQQVEDVTEAGENQPRQSETTDELSAESNAESAEVNALDCETAEVFDEERTTVESESHSAADNVAPETEVVNEQTSEDGAVEKASTDSSEQ